MTSGALHIFSQYEAAFEFPCFVTDLIKLVIGEYRNAPSDLVANSEFETRHRIHLNAILKASGLSKDDRRISKYSFQACLVLLALQDYERLDSSLLYSQSEFQAYYPEYGRLAEAPVLLRFRNIAAVSLTLMKFRNNKGKHLFIATRLSEGKHARYITGSGQSLATTRRLAVLDRENLLLNESMSLGCSDDSGETDQEMEVAMADETYLAALPRHTGGKSSGEVTEVVSEDFAALFRSLSSPLLPSCLDI